MGADNEQRMRERIRQIGKGMEIVGAIGFAAGLAVAAFSGPVAMGAVAAEYSIDLGLAAAGATIDLFCDKMVPLAINLRERFFGSADGKRADSERSTFEVMSKVALLTTPLELITGFSITGFTSNPVAIAAIVVTALPCGTLAFAGLVHQKMKKKSESRRAEHEEHLRVLEYNKTRMKCVDHVQGTETNLKLLQRHDQSARKLKM